MKKIVLIAVVLGLAAGTGSAQQPGGAAGAKDARKVAGTETAQKEIAAMRAETKAFLAQYYKDVAALEIKANLASWTAANSGKKEDFAAVAKASLALRKFHSNRESYKKILELSKGKEQLDPLDARSLKVAELDFKGNQLPAELLKQMVDLSTEIEQTFNTFRAEVGGKKLSNNDLLEMIRKETDNGLRRTYWEALKQVGPAVAPKLIELAKLRNQAARQLGYPNYWEMSVRLQEHEPAELLAIFAELERLTDEPFRKMKGQMDAELSRRFKIAPEEMMPWHYDNPFFQAAPPSEKVDLDEFYKGRKKEDIVKLAETFYNDIGLPIEQIVARSDLYEREGKDQHAFCTSIDRAGDVRTLLNIKPTAEWMDTMLHEQGHAVYDVYIDRSIPFNLRGPAHIFTTEGIAMLFGALGKNPVWMVGYAGADPQRVAELQGAILEQRRREQLIFARWTMVMLHFEKALYEDPDQDLNRLWWDDVTRLQLLHRPADRHQPDWAAKPHFTIAPVYYHNYMLGELFAAQLRHKLSQMAGYQGPTVLLSFNGRKEFGTFLDEKVFRPGQSVRWPQFVEDVTGEKLSAKHFAEETR